MTIKTFNQSSAWVSPTSETQVASPHHTRPDPDIAADVERVLQGDRVLRATADQIVARVNTGVVTLRGYVASDSHRVRAECDAGQVPGIRQVKNQLIADPDLEALVAQTIAQEARLHSYPIFVHSTIGVIHLDGQVDHLEVADAAERCAASVPNVRAVVNWIQSPDVTNRQPEPVFLPGIGQEVYASDGRLGRVEQIVMNPRNRRVTAIVVSAQFYARNSKLERRILIPATAVRHVNASGVELNRTIGEIEQGADFNPAEFVKPGSSWQPPLDYVVGDILLLNEEENQ